MIFAKLISSKLYNFQQQTIIKMNKAKPSPAKAKKPSASPQPIVQEEKAAEQLPPIGVSRQSSRNKGSSGGFEAFLSQAGPVKPSSSVIDKKTGKPLASKRDNSADPKAGGKKSASLTKTESSSALPLLNNARQSSGENVIQNPQMETDRTKAPMNTTQKNVQFKEAAAANKNDKGKPAAKGKEQGKEQPKKDIESVENEKINIQPPVETKQLPLKSPKTTTAAKSASKSPAGRKSTKEAPVRKQSGKLNQSIVEAEPISPSKLAKPQAIFQNKSQPQLPSAPELRTGGVPPNMKLGNCPYCLNTNVHVIDIGCNHSFCTKCCLNLMKISRIKKGLNIDKILGDEKVNGQPQLGVIKCPKCQQLQMLQKDKLAEISDIYEYDGGATGAHGGKSCQLCTAKIPRKADWVCLNCEDTYMCEGCKDKHLKNPRHKGHKTAPARGHRKKFELVEEQQCPDHLQKYRLYCFTDDKPLCLKCTEKPDPDQPQLSTYVKHDSHFVKSIAQVLEGVEKERTQLKQDLLKEVEKIGSACDYFRGVEDILINQKNLQLRKLAADFDVINKLVERKHAEMREKIQTAYDKHLKDSYMYIDGLTGVRETIEMLDQRDIKIDIDQMQLNKAITNRIKEIQQELDFELKDADMDIIESRFMFEPFQKIEKALMEFNFFPVQNSQLKHLEVMFSISQKSKIVSGEIMTPDFLLLCLPPKLASATLLYQYTKELKKKTIINGGGAQRFHAKCDNMGPTLVLIKANQGHIFGGYNPTSWMSDFVYSECEDAFLFSVTDGKGRKPIKCPVKPHKKDKAIKQNEKEYSPAFGEANISDLFIAYKNPSNSYSMLGNVYKLPKGYESETFLAGRHNNWEIEEIEIWAVQF